MPEMRTRAGFAAVLLACCPVIGCGDEPAPDSSEAVAGATSTVAGSSNAGVAGSASSAASAGMLTHAGSGGASPNTGGMSPTGGSTNDGSAGDGGGGSAAAGTAGSAGAPSTGFALAYSADGNQHDYDDWHASPMALALIARANLRSALVHFDYNNHLGDNSAAMAQGHAERVLAAAQHYDFDLDLLYDDQTELDAAVESLARAIDAATSTRRLYLICAGPMEVCWRGINASSAQNRANTTAISHSGWNDDHGDTPDMTHKWSDVLSSGLVVQHLNDQNDPAFSSGCTEWEWLKSSAAAGTGLYDWVCSGPAAGDASDAGMVFYVLQGVSAGATATSNPSMATVQEFFGP